MEVRVDKNGRQYGVCDILAEEGLSGASCTFMFRRELGSRFVYLFRLNSLR